MHLRYALVPTLMLVGLLTGTVRAQDAGGDAAVITGGLDSGVDAAAPAGPSDAGGDGGRGQDGGTITRPGQGADNDALIDEYTDDHGCSCSTATPKRQFEGGVWSLLFAGALVLRARRRR